jgi:PAS domain S-box-containing protein
MRSEEGLILLSEEGTVLWSNRAAADLLGYSQDEFQKMALPIIQFGEGSQPIGPVAKAFKDLIDGEAMEGRGEARFPSKDDKRVSIQWKLWTVPSAQPGKQILLSISEADQASPNSPMVSGEYRDVFEHAVEGVFRSTMDGRLIEANPALARMLGYNNPAELVEALRGFSTLAFVNPIRRSEFVRRLLDQGSVSGFEARIYRADGRVIWVAVFARTVLSADLEPLYVEGSVIDITERKETEAALKRSEERFRLLAETTHFVPFEFDAGRQKFTYVGPQAAALFGPNFRAGLTLDSWTAVVHPEDREAGLRFVCDPASRRAQDSQADFRISATDGNFLWVRQIVSRNVGESAEHVRGFLLEITEAKKVEEDRERSRNQLRDLGVRNLQVREEERMNVAREIHDELGQALTLLRIDLNWLCQQLAKAVPDEARKPLEEKIGTMEQMIHWTLETVRRILAALRPPLLDEVGLKAAIEFHLEDFSKRTAIRYDFETTTVSMLPASPSTAIFRIFQEILTNIARHSGASRVKVCLRESDGKLMLRVQDNGRGILQEKLENSKSFGLLGMEERAWAIGAELEIVGSPRSGTTVTLIVPIANKPTDEG